MVSAPLLQTKLKRPAVADDYVPRPQLLKQLTAHRDYPLILVSAPAGFGKTTLLSAWLQTSDWPGIWLSLDEHDSDIITFLSYFLTAIQNVFPHVGGETFALLSPAALPPMHVLARSLISALEQLDQPFWMVLDDYHYIHDVNVHALLQELLHHSPRALHLALATRFDPALPLADLRTRGKMIDVRSSDLRFSHQETRTFLQNAVSPDIDEQTARDMEESTEGWAAGLRLAALSMRSQGRAGHNLDAFTVEQQINANNHFAMDYLVEEVLAKQSPEMQQFLVRTSILERMCEPLCKAVMADDAAASAAHGAGVLQRLSSANVFIVPLDDRAHWHRYHHLFRQLLQNQLGRFFSQDEIARLHGRASAWLAGHGLIEEALRHATLAADYERVVAIFAQQRHTLLNDEQWHRLRRWLGLFPRSVIEAKPELLMTEAWLARSNMRIPEIPAKLDRAEALIAHLLERTVGADSAAIMSLRGELDCLRSYQYYMANDIPRTLFHGQRGLDTTPREWWSARLMAARLMLAGAHHLAGDDKRAYSTVYDSMAEDVAGPNEESAYRARFLVEAGFVHLFCADIDGLMQVTGQALALSAQRDRPETKYWCHYLRGVAHYYRNELSEAEYDLTAVLTNRHLANAQCAVQAMMALAVTYQAQGRFDAARQTADIAATHALEINHPGLLSVARAFTAELAARQGRIGDASRCLEQYQVLPFTLSVFMSGSADVTWAKVLLANNTDKSLATASKKLSDLCANAEQNHSSRELIEVLALQALLHDAHGHPEAALAALDRALKLAAPHRIVRTFADLGPKLLPLFNQLHSRGSAPAFIEAVLAAMAHTRPSTIVTQHKGLIEPLTERELDVLFLLSQRLSDKEIAARLVISAGTVKRHTHHIYEKLGVGTRREAVDKASAFGLMSLRTAT